jgi:multiple sugar transport system substrate-binding protein
MPVINGLKSKVSLRRFGAMVALSALLPMEAYSAEPISLRVAYSSDFEPITPEAGKAWWDGVIKEFEGSHPGVTIKLDQVPGLFTDAENKIALLFKSERTAPDVVQLSDLNLAQWYASGDLLPLNKYLESAPWWKEFNQQLKANETIDGNVVAVSQGSNVQGLYYDKTLFAKAGIATPWQPKTWNEIIDAAKKLKTVTPAIWPLWITTGATQGTFGVLGGPGNILAGSNDPTILTKDGKWVVDSKGIRETIAFYRDAASAGLLPPISQILDSNALATPPTVMPDHKIGIVLGGNFFADQWTKQISAPFWAEASDNIGVTPLPTINGAAPGTATMQGGWTIGIGAKTKHPDLAWDLINLVQSKKNMLAADDAISIVAPVPKYTEDPAYLAFAPPYRAAFAKISLTATMAPSDPNYSIWAQGLLTATEAVVVDPSVTVDAAVAKLKDYVTNQMEPGTTVSLP